MVKVFVINDWPRTAAPSLLGRCCARTHRLWGAETS